jgi:hypothetical protein
MAGGHATRVRFPAARQIHMDKLYTALAVIAGIIIGAVVVYFRSGISQELDPYPAVIQEPLSPPASS